MVLTGVVIAALAALWAAAAGRAMWSLGLEWRQAVLYAPLSLMHRIGDSAIREARKTDAPVIYAVWHQARIDPALMLSLLPSDTLHILDEASARAGWLEPWRELARTIAFNPRHVFVSRRLERVLKGKGRLAIYFPDKIEPDTKEFRLFRAVARIAQRANAQVVPIFVGGARHALSSLKPAALAPRRPFARLRVTALPGMTIQALIERAGGASMATASGALLDRMAEARLGAAPLDLTLFEATREAAKRFGPGHPIVEDVVTGALSYRRLLAAARIVGRRLAQPTLPGEAVGVMLPNANGAVIALLGLTSAGRVAAMINYTAGPANIASALATARIATVVSSRAFVEKAALGDVVQAMEKAGAHFVWLEELRNAATPLDKIAGMLQWRMPLGRQDPARPAVILFTSGSEGLPKAVVLSHRNLIANVFQVEARITLSPADKLLNVLPMFHSFGLTGGTVLPLVTGARLFLYPSPLHYKIIPDVARRIRPTVMFGTDTFLAAYARTAEDHDFASLRFAVAGAEPVRPETRRVWRERFGAEIVEGFGLTEAAPVVAVNTATHNREGSVGRLLPGMRFRLEPVEGIAEGGRLWVAGPNAMAGYMTPERPGEIVPPDGEWIDTGDIVSIDREGFVSIRGRARRFAKIAGEMVSLGAVEMLVQALWPEDRHAAVAVPDKRRGERVVLVTTATEADAEQLRRWGRKAGATELMVPNDIVKIAEIPLLGSGKTDYVAARRLALTHLGLEQAA